MLNLFTKEQILDIPDYDNKGFVYFLIKENEIIYIGKSINLDSRKNHHQHKDFDTIKAVEVCRTKLNMYEVAYIKQFNPPLNIAENKAYKDKKQSFIYIKNGWVYTNLFARNTNVNLKIKGNEITYKDRVVGVVKDGIGYFTRAETYKAGYSKRISFNVNEEGLLPRSSFNFHIDCPKTPHDTMFDLIQKRVERKEKHGWEYDCYMELFKYFDDEVLLKIDIVSRRGAKVKFLQGKLEDRTTGKVPMDLKELVA